MTRPIARIASIAAAAVLLHGCATYTLVQPQRQTVARTMSVQPGMAWNQSGNPLYEGQLTVWTMDGATLNTAMFLGGVSEGEALFTLKATAAGTPQEKPPVFRRSMSSLEVMELFQATIARTFNTTIVDAGNLKVAQFAGTPGFRFETRFVARDEVERAGTVVGTVRDGKLYAVWFFGAKLHYYERYLPEFERIVASAQLNG